TGGRNAMNAVRHASSAFVSLHMVVVIGLTLSSHLVPDGADNMVIVPCLMIFYALLASALLKPSQIVSGVRTFVSIELLLLIFFFLVLLFPYQQVVLGTLDIHRSRFVPSTFAEKSNQAILLST